MENFTFIKATYTEAQTEEFFAISPDKIQTIRVSHTYVNGQNVNTSDAGDSVTLNTEKAVRIANESFREFNEDEGLDKYSIGDNVSDYDDSNTFSAVSGSVDLQEDIDYTYYAETCKGFNYWDGNNWSSVIVKYDNEEAPFEVIKDQKMILELNKAIEQKEFFKEGFGQKIYKGGEYIITSSQCQGSWEEYSLVPFEEEN